ncbi:hypothetical protein IscW_ISCW000050 [Ixodes scapularis]|uniref:Uncharacterized protein n=1 Tax=Ixodes scapularis TaxID=6945 RepID=B7P114_IXOSC|nr:hypothetical protein IscW_ISCW000050 [Ixodes scapularis]|eukprot:XP_002399876.1 hypothetical protein IscW_ISCW000050 [Ixodes scapularis]
MVSRIGPPSANPLERVPKVEVRGAALGKSSSATRRRADGFVPLRTRGDGREALRAPMVRDHSTNAAAGAAFGIHHGIGC